MDENIERLRLNLVLGIQGFTCMCALLLVVRPLLTITQSFYLLLWQFLRLPPMVSVGL